MINILWRTDKLRDMINILWTILHDKILQRISRDKIFWRKEYDKYLVQYDKYLAQYDKYLVQYDKYTTQ